MSIVKIKAPALVQMLTFNPAAKDPGKAETVFSSVHGDSCILLVHDIGDLGASMRKRLRTSSCILQNGVEKLEKSSNDDKRETCYFLYQARSLSQRSQRA